MPFYFIGVDVGTGSVRAALVTDKGQIYKYAVKTIQTWNPQPDFYEQSSDDIWGAVVVTVKRVVEGMNPADIKGIGFDATCSLVAIDNWGNPLSVSLDGAKERNIILWMDHRAAAETEQINETNHPVLLYVGGKISLEMETPKLLWLKNNLPQQFAKAGFFFDLPDFLTWRATNSDSRSLCSLVCKWTYEISTDGTRGWSNSYFQATGLDELAKDNWKKIGNVILVPGTPVGSGLSSRAAAELGLLKGTPVGASLIDAHAGGLGLIGCSVPDIDSDFKTRLSLICGSSTCHMAVSETPIFTPGIWGPYYSAMVPDMWLNEGGQSATGILLDFVIQTHPASQKILEKIGTTMHIQQYLSNLLQDLADKKGLQDVAFLTKDIHVWPDYHGNRSPIADPTLKGAVCGLTLAQDEESLALLYLATVQALAYGTRHIMESLNESGYETIKSVLICGGLSKNSLFTKTQADVVNLPVVCPREPESVLLGAAILGACAAQYFPDISTAIKSMGGEGTVVHPNEETGPFHKQKYHVFLKMHKHQMQYRDIMN